MKPCCKVFSRRSQRTQDQSGCSCQETGRRCHLKLLKCRKIESFIILKDTITAIFIASEVVKVTYRATYRTDLMFQKLEFAQSCRNSNLENRCATKLCFHWGGKRGVYSAILLVILNTTYAQAHEQYTTCLSVSLEDSVEVCYKLDERV